MNHPTTPNTNSPFNLNPLVARLAVEIEDRRLLAALSLCQEQIREPALGLTQIRTAFGMIRPKGMPCDRTIQRWVERRGMPWALDSASNQRVYFLSKCLSWYQRTFPVVSGSEDAEACARDTILRSLDAPGRRLRRQIA
jgi:hypothetical protein